MSNEVIEATAERVPAVDDKRPESWVVMYAVLRTDRPGFIWCTQGYNVADWLPREEAESQALAFAAKQIKGYIIHIPGEQ